MKKILLFFLFSFSLLGTSLAQQDKAYGLLFESIKHSTSYDPFGIYTDVGYYHQGTLHLGVRNRYFSRNHSINERFYSYSTVGADIDSIVVQHSFDPHFQNQLPNAHISMNIFFMDNSNDPNDVGLVRFTYGDNYNFPCDFEENQYFLIVSKFRYICSDEPRPMELLFLQRIYTSSTSGMKEAIFVKMMKLY